MSLSSSSTVLAPKAKTGFKAHETKGRENASKQASEQTHECILSADKYFGGGALLYLRGQDKQGAVAVLCKKVKIRTRKSDMPEGSHGHHQRRKSSALAMLRVAVLVLTALLFKKEINVLAGSQSECLCHAVCNRWPIANL